MDEYSIEKKLFVLIGLPTETRQDFEETKSVSKACNPTRTYLNIFYPPCKTYIPSNIISTKILSIRNYCYVFIII